MSTDYLGDTLKWNERNQWKVVYSSGNDRKCARPRHLIWKKEEKLRERNSTFIFLAMLDVIADFCIVDSNERCNTCKEKPQNKRK